MGVNGQDEGYLSAIQHVARKLNVPMPAVEEAIKWRLINQNEFEGRISPKSVVHVTAEYFGVGCKEIVDSTQRFKYVLRARHAAMYIMREVCVVRAWGKWKPVSYQQIAFNFNKRRHTSALNAHSIVLQHMEKDAKYKRDITTIMSLLGR